MCKKYRLIGFAVGFLILGLTAAYATEGVVRTGFNDETVAFQELPSLNKDK